MTASSVNVVSQGIEALLGPQRLTVRHTVRSLVELGGVLERLPPGRARRLDLIGHSTRVGQLLRLGETVIDMFDPRVDRYFRALARDGVLARLDVVAVRLLGCETAERDVGQRTLVRLARVLRVPVFGAKKALLKSHYDAKAFMPCFEHILVESGAFAIRARPLSRPDKQGAVL